MISLYAQVKIDGISCDYSVTSATILPKGGPSFSCKGAFPDFFQVSIPNCSCVDTPLVPKIPKLPAIWACHKKNIFEKVPKGGTVIVCGCIWQNSNFIFCPPPTFLKLIVYRLKSASSAHQLYLLRFCVSLCRLL